MTEAQLHKSVADYLRVALRPPTTWTTMPAGGGGRIRGAQLKAMGLAPGWPDIIVLHPAGHYRTLVLGIELKTAKGRLSDHQKARIEEFFGCNAKMSVARSIDEVEGMLRLWGIPVHARAA